MVYEIRNDGFKFQGFYLDPYVMVDFFPDDIDIFDTLQFYAKDLKMGPHWKSLDAEFKPIEDLPVGPIPDICTWIGSSLIFSPKAYEALNDTLSLFGEFLPILVNTDTFYIFNCLTHGMTDQLRSKAMKVSDSGDLLQEEKIIFNSIDIKEKYLFKTNLNNCSVLYCNDKFKDLYHSKNLTGITFDPLN